MPSSKEHLEKARRNYVLYERFQTEAQDPDWALTLLFYAALHLVQAYAVQDCARRNRPAPRHHTERLGYVRDRLASIFRSYRRLQSGSEQARYDLVLPTSEEVQEYHDAEFAAIRTELGRRGVTL